jgi:hypothetical protein
MRKPATVFRDLQAEFERRSFCISQIRPVSCSESEAFEAHNARLTHIPERIRVSLTENGVYVRIVEKGTWKLNSQGVERIFARFSKYFQASEATGSPELFLGADMGMLRDLAEVADISTRAYACTMD